MSSMAHLLILTTDTEETNDDLRAPMIAVNAWCDEHARGQRFERLNDEAAAGGHKVWSMAAWACCGNYFPTREFIKAFPTFGWNSFVADVTCLVVRDETIHSGDAWIAIDGHGGALTREPDLGYGRQPPPPPVKLFVWTDLEALEDWAPGNAFALASTREEAIDLIVADEGGNATLRAELEASEPRVHDAPAGYAIMGGS